MPSSASGAVRGVGEGVTLGEVVRSEELGTEKAVEGTVQLVVSGEVTTSVELCGISVDGGAAGAVVRVGGWLMVQVAAEDEDETVDGTVVKPPLRGLAAGVLMLGWVEVMGVDLVVVPGRSSATVTLLQVLQHIRWKSGRAQCRFRASRRQKVERSPLQRRPVE